jgi:hypothetical protein
MICSHFIGSNDALWEPFSGWPPGRCRVVGLDKTLGTLFKFHFEHILIHGGRGGACREGERAISTLFAIPILPENLLIADHSLKSKVNPILTLVIA